MRDRVEFSSAKIKKNLSSQDPLTSKAEIYSINSSANKVKSLNTNIIWHLNLRYAVEFSCANKIKSLPNNII